MATKTHYEILGVSPSASPEEVRRAYRSLARRLHPDHQSAATPAERIVAERRIRQVNEAWRTLGDPARRRSYDATLRSGRGPTTPGARPAGPAAHPARPAPPPERTVDVFPNLTPRGARILRAAPWIVLGVVLTGIFVFTAYALHAREPATRRNPATPATAPGPLPVELGSCVLISPGPSTIAVPCSQANDGRIVATAPTPRQCPNRTFPRRLNLGDPYLACLVPTDGGPMQIHPAMPAEP